MCLHEIAHTFVQLRNVEDAILIHVTSRYQYQSTDITKIVKPEDFDSL